MSADDDYRADVVVAQRVKELLSEKDPTIDWSKVKSIADLQTGEFYFESDDPETHDRLVAARAAIKADREEEPSGAD